MKECVDEGTYPYWLRSVDATSSHCFCGVDAGGGAAYLSAGWSYGFAPGFDI